MKNGLLGALLILAAIALAISLTGCAAKKPTTSPLAIPKKCIQNILPTDKTRCDQIDGKPNHAMCDGVEVVFGCVRVNP